MAAPTQAFTLNLSSQFPAGVMDVQRKVKVNPFAASTGGTASVPLRDTGKQYPR